MFALPGQTLEQCEQDVKTALSFGTSHLSLYHLTIEPNTYFAKFPPAIPDDDLSADMHQMLRDQLSSAGYINYEVSAYAKPGRMSRHNLNYWQFGDYLGIGAGAHSKLSFPHRIVRQMRHKQPKAYMQAVAEGNAAQKSSEVATEDLPFEFMLNTLRLRDGFQLLCFRSAPD
jgi:oxygen-independent coproporphyrinogen-3 oxidase